MLFIKPVRVNRVVFNQESTSLLYYYMPKWVRQNNAEKCILHTLCTVK